MESQLESVGCDQAVCALYFSVHVSAQYRIYIIMYTFLARILNIVFKGRWKQNFHLETIFPEFKPKQSGKELAVQPAPPSLGRLSLHSPH